ncbi:hypothetical protein D3C75_798080 [compost metagenome]
MHRVDITWREGDAKVGLFFHIGGNPQFQLGLAIPGFQLLIIDRPIDTDAI